MLFKIILLFLVPSVCFSHSLHHVFKKVNPTVVVIHIEDSKAKIKNVLNKSINKKNIGSGVVISRDGKIMTASHLVHSADNITVEFLNGQKIPAHVLSSVPQADVALIQLKQIPDFLKVAPLGDSDQARVGDEIFVIGAPYGYSHTISKGIISARYAPGDLDTELGMSELIQTDAAINTGNSGGPMFNDKGEVIAIVSHIITHSGGNEGLGFAVTSNMSKKILLEEKPIWSGLDGIIITKLAGVLNVPQKAGYLVQHVARDSIADKLGIQGGTIPTTIYDTKFLLGGDIIIEMLGITIKGNSDTFKQIRKKLSLLKNGDEISVKVLRNGRILLLSNHLGNE